jgi:predicted Zn-dependent protease
MRRVAVLIVLFAIARVVAAAPAKDAAAEGAQLMARGRYAEARAKLEPAALGARAFAARYQLGLLYRILGERERERALWNRFYDDFESGAIDKKSARELTYVARAAQLLGSWKDANDTFRDAVDADPKGKDGARANIAWGRLFLEKYDAGHAEACIDDALAVLPEDAEARTVLAAVKIEQSYDTAGALRELDRAERSIPNYAEAEELRARIALEDEDHPRAQKLATALLARNPEDISARTTLAGIALLEDDRAAFEEQRRLVLATHPRASSFFHELGELMVRNHRYLDAVPLEEEALRVDDKDAVARAAYGANLLRLNREDEGLSALRAAWQKDKYNVRTYNLLQLFEDVIPKRYTMIDAPPFRLRVPTSERALLEQTIVPFLKHAEKTLTGLYGFSPKGPIQVELYTDPQHYAVRTIGLPGLDAIGVTFGPLITCLSPSLGKFNWGMVLWHELSHVYAIEASKSRVPRWFTEGLSEYETTVVDPLWTRRTSAELASALFRGELLPVEQLDRAFVHARNLSQMVVAYHESAAAVRYFVERAGRPAIMVALRGFSQNQRFTDIVKRITGQDAAAFDADFRAWLRAKLKGYEGQLAVRPADYSDNDALEARLKAHPEDGRARGLLAVDKLLGGQLAEAKQLVAGAKRKAPELGYAAVRIALAEKHTDEAKIALQLLRGEGGAGADVELLAARVAKASNDIDGTWAALAAAAIDDPDRGEIPALEAELAASKPTPVACNGDARSCEIAALTRATDLDVMDATLARRLFDRLVTANSAHVPEAAKRALDITPFDHTLRVSLAGWLHAHGDDPAARAELARAKLCPLQGEAPAAEHDLESKLAVHGRH